MNAAGIIFSDAYDVPVNELTRARTLAALPFGGRYRVVDFTLSNMANAGIQNIGIVTTRNYNSLMYHIRGGAVWDLDKKRSALTFLPPYGSDNYKGMYHSRLEAMQTHRKFIEALDEKYVVLVCCNYIGNIDLGKMIDFHIKSGARITALYTRKPMFKSEGERLPVYAIGARNKLENVEIVQKLEAGDAYGVDCFVIEKETLLEVLDMAARDNFTSFGTEVLQKMAKNGDAVAYEATETMMFMDTTADYMKSSLALLDHDIMDELFEQDGRPIETRARDSAPTRYGENAVVENCLIADGVRIEGTVRNSIIFRDVRIKKGSVVENCVIMQDAVVGENVNLSYAILDNNVIINDGRMLGGYITHPFYLDEGTVI